MVSQKVSDSSVVSLTGDVSLFWEKRMEYTGSNPIYVGYNKAPNESTATASWFIIKLTYSGDNVTRVQLPDNGPQFKYAWDDRASTFS